ncbi:tetratricopeptide repeat protein, partial [Sphingomonas sp. CCH5-D11]|uniref:tetratricopeptide repeat protein n=1 Tax=Sphingomonas sp. CCH5-D11 TaxID=1768786 RepID=UPI000A4FD34C
MNKRAVAGFSLTALMLGGAMVGCAQGGISTASTRSEATVAKHAARNAEKAAEALQKGDPAKAVSFAEAAVAAVPNNADYRALLGSAYLKAGRFTSAHAAYADVLALSPQNGRAALNLALAMIAEGQWDEARQALESNAAIVPASDRGLAIALAGDPAGGVE